MNKNTELSKSQINKAKERLGKLLTEFNNHQWEIGDLLNELIEKGGQKLGALAQEFQFALSTLSQFSTTAKAFPTAVRRTDLPFWRSNFAYYAEKRAVAEAAKRGFTDAEPNYVQALEIIEEKVAEKETTLAPNGKPNRAGINKREATEAVSWAKRDELMPQSLAKITIPSECHHKRNEDLLDELIAKGVKSPLIHFDPPYASYRKVAGGKLDTSTSRSANVGGDNLTEDDAIQTTCDSIERAEKVLAVNGCILVWQAANCPLRMPILQTLEKCGLMVECVVTWDKGISQPGSFTDPWSMGSEILYVLRRDNERLTFQELGHRQQNVIHIAPVQHRAGQWDETHFWIKPAEMMELLVKLHSQPGDLVLDLFGCTGSMSIAAQKLGRQWIYCESHKDNFDLGSRRIAEAMNPTKSEDEEPPMKLAA